MNSRKKYIQAKSPSVIFTENYNNRNELRRHLIAAQKHLRSILEMSNEEIQINKFASSLKEIELPSEVEESINKKAVLIRDIYPLYLKLSNILKEDFTSYRPQNE